MNDDLGTPLILTVLFAPEDGDALNDLRRRHFPPARNMIPAHVTLFHKLPGHRLSSIVADIRMVCADVAPMDLSAPGLRFLGHGVAIELASDALVSLRRNLAGLWAADLSAQDRQGFRPHVTIQNKVPAVAARRLYDDLRADWMPRIYRADGLQLWHYEGGPWRAEAEIRFGISAAP